MCPALLIENIVFSFLLYILRPLLGISAIQTKDNFIIFGGGDTGGVFAPVVDSIYTEISLSKSTRQRCQAIVTGGSIHNLLGVQSEAPDAGLTMPVLINEK